MKKDRDYGVNDYALLFAEKRVGCFSCRPDPYKSESASSGYSGDGVF